jgi:hypothetical protein
MPLNSTETTSLVYGCVADIHVQEEEILKKKLPLTMKVLTWKNLMLLKPTLMEIPALLKDTLLSSEIFPITSFLKKTFSRQDSTLEALTNQIQIQFIVAVTLTM